MSNECTRGENFHVIGVVQPNTSLMNAMPRIKKCNKCSKIGHFALVCRSLQTRKDNQKVKEREIVNRINKRYKVRAVEGQAESSGEQDSASQSDEEYVLYIKNKDDHLLISVNGRKIKTVADTGCKQNIISSQLYKEQFKRCPLKTMVRT